MRTHNSCPWNNKPHVQTPTRPRCPVTAGQVVLGSWGEHHPAKNVNEPQLHESERRHPRNTATSGSRARGGRFTARFQRPWPAAVRKRSRDNPGGRQSMSFKLPTILSCVTKSHLGCDSSWWLWSSDTYLITAPNGSNSDAGTCRSANEEPWCASFTRKVRPYRESMVQRVRHHPVSGNCWDLGTQSPADMGGLLFTHSEWVHFSTFKTKQKKCLRMHAEMLKEKLQRKRESDNINSVQWWTWGIWEGDRMEGVWNVVANDFMVAGYVGICFVIFL